MPNGSADRDPRALLAFALDKYPERVEAIDLRELVMESARQNPKRPAYLKVAVPDAWVKALRGPREGSSRLLVVEVPEDVDQRAGSSIILPGEAAP